MKKLVCFLLSLFLFSSCVTSEEVINPQKELEEVENIPVEVIVPVVESNPENDMEKISVLNLSFIGDIMAHDVNYKYRPLSNIYKNVKDVLLADDLSFGNLEFPVDPEKVYSTYPTFNVKPEYVQAAIDGGLDIFSMANNHTTDQGIQSIVNTHVEMEKLDGIVFSGIEKAPITQMVPEEISIQGWEIGFLAVTAILNSYNGSEYVNLINYMNPAKREEFIKYIKKIVGNYDFFILSVHAGREYATTPDKDKLLFYQDLVKAGVGIVWGHHPHVLQPMEIVVVEGRKGLILPSCGNFISGQTWHLNPEDYDESRAFTGDSAIFQVQLIKNEDFAEVLNVEPLLISNYRDPKNGMGVHYLEDLAVSRSIPEKWRKYYNSRLPIIKELVGVY